MIADPFLFSEMTIATAQINGGLEPRSLLL
jgi:hypothetical protein